MVQYKRKYERNQNSYRLGIVLLEVCFTSINSVFLLEFFLQSNFQLNKSLEVIWPIYKGFLFY